MLTRQHRQILNDKSAITNQQDGEKWAKNDNNLALWYAVQADRSESQISEYLLPTKEVDKQNNIQRFVCGQTATKTFISNRLHTVINVGSRRWRNCKPWQVRIYNWGLGLGGRAPAGSGPISEFPPTEGAGT